VLLVDDDPRVLDVLAETFRFHGCEVTAVPTAEQALVRLGAEPADLLVTDVNLPGLSGLDLLQAVPRRQPGMPVVLVAGAPDVESVACATRHHAYDYLTKPVTVEDVRKLVERLRRDRQTAHATPTAEDRADQLLRTEALVRLSRVAIEGREPGPVLERILADVSRSVRADAALVIHRDQAGAFAHRRWGDGLAFEALPTLLRAGLSTLPRTAGVVSVPIAPPEGPVSAIATAVPTASGTVLLAVARDARHGPFLADEEGFLLAYSRMAGLVLERLVLTERIEGQVQDTVGSLVRALEAKDPALRAHAARVSLYAGEIGRALRLPDAELDVIRRAGLLHDLGKLTVLDLVLKKPGPLTAEEYSLVQRHPVAGERMLRPLPALAETALIVRHHAERYDGTGYPDRLRGLDIPLPARIIAIADAFDAMTSARPYRPARPLDEARGEILKQAGRQFDPAVAGAFLGIAADRLVEVSGFYRSPDEGR
jgi:response regulator RpfG family c-di-GMP phosphodiesterase